MTNQTVDGIYFYHPSLAAAILFAILYGALDVVHLHLALLLPRSNLEKHRYTIPLFVAATLSTAGYGVRIASVKTPNSIPLYAISASWIVIAPIFVCATMYLSLAHLVRRCIQHPKDQKLFGFTPRWLGRVFITSDVISFLTQCGGSGIASSNDWTGNTESIGADVLLAGLSSQLATFSIFLVLLGKFCLRIRAVDKANVGRGENMVIRGLWVAGFFVQIRTIYRVIEFALGFFGYPFTHEWPLYVLESLPMFIALGVLGCCHPVRWLQRRNVPARGVDEELT